MIIDAPDWFPRALQLIKKSGKAAWHPFRPEPGALLAAWCEACADLRISADRYQLRHSGASADTLARSRTPLEVMARGRWRTLKSVQRYAKSGALQKAVARLPSKVRRFAQWCQENQEGTVMGEIIVERPSFSGLPLTNLIN